VGFVVPALTGDGGQGHPASRRKQEQAGAQLGTSHFTGNNGKGSKYRKNYERIFKKKKKEETARG